MPGETVRRSSLFLDAVQKDSGTTYGYLAPGDGSATTAIGTLSRMYLGWKKDNPALERSVAWLSAKGPSPTNMYYNYYATQVLRHWDGEPWRKWDAAMRSQLVQSQSQHGHERGSWHFSGGDHGSESGGRLYFTALCAMTLEVYFRHQPLYKEYSTTEEFRLD